MFHQQIYNRVVLLLGSNLGNREANIRFGEDQLEEKAGRIISTSSVYESESWGFKSASFLNKAIAIQTKLSPQKLLVLLKIIEKASGRKANKNAVYQDRTLDIDILFFNDQVIDEQNLQIPHPRLQERNFALIPLKEIMPYYRHPVLKKNITELHENCKDRGMVKAI